VEEARQEGRVEAQRKRRKEQKGKEEEGVNKGRTVSVLVAARTERKEGWKGRRGRKGKERKEGKEGRKRWRRS
jgi:hypothetical protein